MTTVYWTQKDGTKISVDDMSVQHLRNTLKMIIKAMNVAKVTPKIKPITKGEIAREYEDMAMLYSISPELTCTCDELHVCQQCMQEL